MTQSSNASSSKAIVQSAASVLRRFPGVLFVTLVGCIAAIRLVLITEAENSDRIFLGSAPLLLICLLGIPWLYSLSLFSERRFKGIAKDGIPALVGFLTLALYYFRLRAYFQAGEFPNSFPFELAGLLAALHFLAAYAPFIGRREPRAFWEYNKAIFLRILLSQLFSLTLQLGISILLLILGALTGLNLVKTQIIVTILLSVLFATSFFLAGVPSDWEALEREPRPYPRLLKYFSVFVLMPLAVAIGLGLDLLFLREFLSGERVDVGWVYIAFVLGGSGLLAYLLAYPLTEDSAHRGPRFFQRGFFLLLLPLLAWIVHSAAKLIGRYGWTEPRYFELILSLWGLGLSIYFVLARRAKIQWIPMSLSLLALASSIGPLSALKVTQRSQAGRLATLLKNAKLPNPITAESLVALPDAQRSEIFSQVTYLDRDFSCTSLEPYFGALLKSDKDNDGACHTGNLTRFFLRAPNTSVQDIQQEPRYINFLSGRSSDEGTQVSGFDYYFSDSALNLRIKGEGDCPKDPPALSVCVMREKDGDQLELNFNGRNLGNIDLKPAIAKLYETKVPANEKTSHETTSLSYDVKPSEFSFDYPLAGAKARLVFYQIQVAKRGDRLQPSVLTFYLLLKNEK